METHDRDGHSAQQQEKGVDSSSIHTAKLDDQTTSIKALVVNDKAVV